MRLDDDNNINVEDQRGQSFGGGGFGGGGGLIFSLLPMVASRFGCLGVAVLLGALFFFGGGLQMLGGGGQQVGGPAQQQQTPGGGVAASCSVDPASRAACNAFGSAENTWEAVFARNGQRFQNPKLVFYAGGGRSACGAAQSAMGPFYCPGDQGIYLDTSFFQELASRFGAKGDFAQDYVIAHEFGHHIQNLLGASEQVARVQRSGDERAGNAASVRLELQADCYAGVWAALNKNRLEPGDIEEGMTAANAIGDDTLQRESRGTVVPDSFTHGSSAQRMQWLRRGLESGDPGKRDTFSEGN